jgi:hypothetical protein
MDADAAKAYLHTCLKHECAAVLAKLDGLAEYNVRRPLTATEGPSIECCVGDTPYDVRDTPRLMSGRRSSGPWDARVSGGNMARASVAERMTFAPPYVRIPAWHRGRGSRRARASC